MGNIKCGFGISLSSDSVRCGARVCGYKYLFVASERKVKSQGTKGKGKIGEELDSVVDYSLEMLVSV